MILAAGLVLLASLGPLDEAEAALAAGRLEQTEKMVAQLASEGVRGPRFDRLRAARALASGEDEAALALFVPLAERPDGLASDREGAAIAAYRLGRRDEALRWVDLAMDTKGSGWRSFNLCGVLADEAGDFAKADACYAEAAVRAPRRSEIVNNQGWSLLLRGEWARAASTFEQALSLDPGDRVTRSNLDLARSAQADNLPARKEGESDNDYGRRLNDAGVMAEASGKRARAIAAFANAIEVRPRWSPVTARNLEEASHP